MWLSSDASERLALEYADDALDGPRWISAFRLCAATGAAPRIPTGSVSPEVGLPSEYWIVPSLGDAAWWYPGALPASDMAIPTPAPLDKLVDAFRPAEVVPHPRYPDVSSLGAKASPIPRGGSVGSLFGLNP